MILPEGFGVDDVDTDTPAVIEQLDLESDHMNVSINEDGFVKIVAAFDRAAFCSAATDDGPVEVTVTGLLSNCQYFYGTDTIRIINNK